MRAVLVDPDTRTVQTIDTDGKLKSLQQLVDGHIEGVYPAYEEVEFSGTHGYVDEEFLYSGKDKSRPWSLPGYPYLLGRGVFLGSTDSGDEAPCPMSAEQVAKHVTWLRR